MFPSAKGVLEMHLKRLAIGLVLSASVCCALGTVCRAGEGGPGRETPRRARRSAWPGSATPGSACSSTGASIPCPPASGTARRTTASGSSKKPRCPSPSTRSSRGQFNPVKFDAKEWVRHRQGRRDEIHRHHQQAPRRLRHVPLGPDRLVHQVHALPARPAQGAGRRLPGGRASSSASTTRSWTGTIPTGAPAAPGTTRPPARPTWTATPTT